MSRFSMFIAGGALTLAASGIASAQTATQTVTYTVNAVNQISVASPTASVTVTTALAGDTLSEGTAASSYAITTNGSLMKITAELDSDMPAGISLKAAFAAPAGGASAGSVALTLLPQNVVTGITQLFNPTLAINYRLNALITIAPTTTGSRIVTLTIAQGT